MKALLLQFTEREFRALNKQKKYEGKSWKRFIMDLFYTYDELIRGDDTNESKYTKR